MAGHGKNQRPRQHRLELGQPDNIVAGLAQLNQLISDHPCFLRRRKTHALEPAGLAGLCAAPRIGRRQRLRAGPGQHGCRPRKIRLRCPPRTWRIELAISNSICWASRCRKWRRQKIRDVHAAARRGLLPGGHGKAGGLERRRLPPRPRPGRLAIEALNEVLPAEKLSSFDWQWLAEQVESSPQNFLAAASRLTGGESQAAFSELIQKAVRGEIFPACRHLDAARSPPGHACSGRPLAAGRRFRAV